MSEPVSDAELRDYETLLREGRSVGEEDWCDEPMTRLIAEVRRLREREDANFKLLESVKEWFPPEHYAAITAENDRLRQQAAEKPSRPGVVKYLPPNSEQERLSREHQAAVMRNLEQTLGGKFGPPVDVSKDRWLLTEGAPGIPEKPLAWTKEPPTEDGFYWRRCGTDVVLIRVALEFGPIGKGVCEWAGPLAPPA